MWLQLLAAVVVGFILGVNASPSPTIICEHETDDDDFEYSDLE
jgi:hypothetical protein